MKGSDAELVERIRNGAPDEFAEIVRQHQSFVVALLSRYEKDAHRLEDLAQETFVKVWRALDRFDGRAPLQHWISRIAVHVALDHLRRAKRQRHEVGFPELGEDALDWLRPDGSGSELAASGARELLDYALGRLSPQERLVITLQELEGRSIKEICALTGSSSVAVRVRAMRARSKLKKALLALEQQTHGRSET